MMAIAGALWIRKPTCIWSGSLLPSSGCQAIVSFTPALIKVPALESAFVLSAKFLY
jgi:hypothetical protein